MTKARIGNKEFNFRWDNTFHNATFNGEKIEIQPSEKKGHFCLKYQNKNYRGEWITFHSETKIATIKINHSEFNVTIIQPIDALLEKLGMGGASSKKVKNLKAPMPGLVRQILVNIDEQVSKDTPLLILEAMKMENVIKAQGEGKIKSIQVNQGQAVEKSALLVEFY
jgi:acetyl/propionyl-CoA carboxylase alpha subunit